MLKKYKLINLTIIFMKLYVVIYPLIAKFVGKLFPELVSCPYKLMTGDECPFCGTTRTLKGFITGVPTESLCINGLIIFAYVLLSIVFRIMILFFSSYTLRTMIFDGLVTLLFAAYICAVIINFFV